MKRVFSKYFVCEEGHVTAGDSKKTKCDATGYQVNYVKGKRKGSWVEEKVKTKACGKPIVKEGDIPEDMDYTQVWDHEVMHAFLIGQKFDAEFIIGLQKINKRMYNMIEEIRDRSK